jgi:hypothetical protein
VGVAWVGDDASFQGFVDKHSLTFPQISDDPGDVYDRFGVPVQPAMAIVGTDGSVELLGGAVDAATLDQLLTDATS